MLFSFSSGYLIFIVPNVILLAGKGKKKNIIFLYKKAFRVIFFLRSFSRVQKSSIFDKSLGNNNGFEITYFLIL